MVSPRLTPRTAKCSLCLRVRNRLSVYPSSVGKMCRSCLLATPVRIALVTQGRNLDD